MLPDDNLYATADSADVQEQRCCRVALVSIKPAPDADTKGPNLAELGKWILECNIESLDFQVDPSGMRMDTIEFSSDISLKDPLACIMLIHRII